MWCHTKKRIFLLLSYTNKFQIIYKKCAHVMIRLKNFEKKNIIIITFKQLLVEPIIGIIVLFNVDNDNDFVVLLLNKVAISEYDLFDICIYNSI
jgi:hypothetical protein